MRLKPSTQASLSFETLTRASTSSSFYGKNLPKSVFVFVFMVFIVAVLIWCYKHNLQPDLTLLKIHNTKELLLRSSCWKCGITSNWVSFTRHKHATLKISNHHVTLAYLTSAILMSVYRSSKHRLSSFTSRQMKLVFLQCIAFMRHQYWYHPMRPIHPWCNIQYV